MQTKTGLVFVWLMIVALLAGCRPIQRVAGPATTALYQTGFEPADFTLGALDTQQGWLQSVGQRGGATISTLLPATGRQALRNDGALMAPVLTRPWSGVLTMYPLNYNVIEHNTPILMIEADVRLDGPTSGLDADDASVNANLVAVGLTASGSAGLAFNSLSSREAIFTVGGASAPVTLGTYHRLGLRLDFTQQTAAYFLNGVSFGVEPFRDTQAAVGLFGVRLDLVGSPAVAAQYTAFYDNLTVSVVAQ